MSEKVNYWAFFFIVEYFCKTWVLKHGQVSIFIFILYTWSPKGLTVQASQATTSSSLNFLGGYKTFQNWQGRYSFSLNYLCISKAAIHSNSMEAFCNYRVCLCIFGFSCLGNWDLNLIYLHSNQKDTNSPCQPALLHSTNCWYHIVSEIHQM